VETTHLLLMYLRKLLTTNHNTMHCHWKSQRKAHSLMYFRKEQINPFTMKLGKMNHRIDNLVIIGNHVPQSIRIRKWVACLWFNLPIAFSSNYHLALSDQRGRTCLRSSKSVKEIMEGKCLRIWKFG